MSSKQLPGGAFVIGTNSRQSQMGRIYFNDNSATANATLLTLTGPTQGATGSASSTFTIGDNGYLPNPVVVTPHSDVAGTFTPATVTMQGANALGSFTFTPDAGGPYSITLTNDGGLADPAPASYQAIDLPVAVITSQVVNGQTVTINGTVTSNPTSGKATLPVDTSGTTQGPTDVTINGDGTFTVTWDAVPVGVYQSPVVTFANVVGMGSPASGGSPITILGIDGQPVPANQTLTAVITSESLSGSDLTVSGTYTDVPTTVTASITPTLNGAAQTNVPVTFSAGTWSVVFTGLVDGDYAAPMVTFTNASGSATATGGNPVTVNSAVPAPTAAITSQNLSGSDLTVSGTYTGTPTSASAAITATSGGVSQNNVAVSFSAGTWSAVFSNLANGNYDAPVVTFTNTSGSNAATGGTPVVVNVAPAPTAAITSENLVGSDLTVSGTYTGVPVSAVASIATTTTGVSQNNVPVTFSGGTWSAVFSGLANGDYAAPVITFTNATGSSAATGGTPVTVNVPPPLEAPTVSINSASLTFATLNASGVVDLKGDAAGTLNAQITSVPAGTTLGPFAVTPVNGVWTYQSPILSPGSWKLTMTAVANAFAPVTADSNPVSVVSLTGTPVLPL